MKARFTVLRSSRTWRLALVTVLALLPLSLAAWQSAQKTLPPGAAVAIPFEGAGWQDKVLTHEGYVMPPRELADAVLAPREMNMTLGNQSPDKKWFLDDINEGPTPMAIFGRPFDELGGVFIDFRANRLRSVTLRNTSGIQMISAADGSRKAIATPGRHARDQRALDARQHGRRLHDARRRRDPHLDHGPRDEQTAPGDEGPLPRDLRDELRLRQQRQVHRRRLRARGPHAAAAPARGAGGAGNPPLVER